MKINQNITATDRRKRRVRSKVRGTTARPRLHVYRSNKNISLQVIDDAKGKTIASISTLTTEVKGTKTEKATLITQELMKQLKAAKVSRLVFDRGIYKYHGRVRAVAEAARAAGIEV
jgi:large subunit ribosomal protein L18